MSANGNEIVASWYAEHRTSLRSYVRRLVPGYQLSHAEDVVQETFACTIKHLSKGMAIDSPKAFLFTTARHLITSMFYRRRRPLDRDSIPYVDDDECVSRADVCSLEHRLTMEQTLDAICHAVAALPARYQEAFVRRRVWGESCREIAAKMQLSEQAVSNYATLGWKLLREYCEEHNIVLNDVFLTETRRSG